MWAWQRVLLQWRVRRIFAASRNFERIERTRLFIDPANPPRLGSSNAALYVELVLRQDADVRTVAPLDAYLPPHPSVRAQQRIADSVISALHAAPVEVAERASRFARSAPDHAAALADAIAQRARQSERSFVFAAVPSLAPLAREDDHAWSILRALADDPTTHVRYYTAGALAGVTTRAPEAIETLRRMLRDPSEDVTRNALSSLDDLAPTLCDYAPEIWAAGLQGPNIGADALRILKRHACDTPSYRDAVRATLASDNPEHVRHALRAIVSMGALDDATAEALRALATSGPLSARSQELEAALVRFSIRAAPTEPPVPGE
jgi:hypothetical protein